MLFQGAWELDEARKAVVVLGVAGRGDNSCATGEVIKWEAMDPGKK